MLISLLSPWSGPFLVDINWVYEKNMYILKCKRGSPGTVVMILSRQTGVCPVLGFRSREGALLGCTFPPAWRQTG